MMEAALYVAIGTAVVGLPLLVLWLMGGGHRQPDPEDVRLAAEAARLGHARDADAVHSPSHLGSAQLGMHIALGVSGIVLIAFHLAVKDDSEYDPLAWFNVAWFAVAGILGVLMVRTWAADRKRWRHDPDAPELAEQRFPALLVLLHGLGGVATLVLLVWAAIEL